MKGGARMVGTHTEGGARTVVDLCSYIYSN